LQLHGVLAHWAECVEQPWLEPLLAWEESERSHRSLERRLRCAHIGRFKPLADFDWAWPEQCDQAAIAELMTLDFLNSATNAILVGPSGLGKTTIAQNIAHQATLQGHTVLFATAGQLLGELASLDSDSALRYRLRRYAAPSLLVVDEVGYPLRPNVHLVPEHIATRLGRFVYQLKLDRAERARYIRCPTLVPVVGGARDHSAAARLERCEVLVLVGKACRDRLKLGL